MPPKQDLRRNECTRYQSPRQTRAGSGKVEKSATNEFIINILLLFCPWLPPGGIRRNIIPDIQRGKLFHLNVLFHPRFIRHRERKFLGYKIIREYTINHDITRFCILRPYDALPASVGRFAVHLYIAYHYRGRRLKRRRVLRAVRHRDPGVLHVQKVDSFHADKYIFRRPVLNRVSSCRSTAPSGVGVPSLSTSTVISIR